MDDRLLTILQTARQLTLTTGRLHPAVARGATAAIRVRPRGHIRIRETDRRGWSDCHASRGGLDRPRLMRLPERSPGASDSKPLFPAGGSWGLA
jgi:hypothetical protein